MQRRKLFLLLLVFVIGSRVVIAQDTRDSVMYQKDSAVVPETDATVLFFQQNEKIPSHLLGKTLITGRDKKVRKLSAMVTDQQVMYTDHALADLDDDGKKELLISNFTGGAHCCDQIFIYRQLGPNRYVEAARLVAGHTIITEQKEFLYSLHEQFGYFFTCYACTYSDTTDEAPIDVSRLTLRYKSGKLQVVVTDKELKSIINDNLGKLGEQPYVKPEDEVMVDDGLRKEFAINLAAWYFSYGKNLADVQRLFNKNFKFPDAKKVWPAFTRQLTALRAQNSF